MIINSTLFFRHRLIVQEERTSVPQLKRLDDYELEELTNERDKLTTEVIEKINKESQKLDILESKYQGYKSSPPWLCNRSGALRIIILEATKECTNEILSVNQ